MFSQLRFLVWKAILLTAALSLLAFSVALAASGDLDTTFSGDGRLTTDFSGGWHDRVMAIALQPNGRIVAVGDHYDPANPHATSADFALARYLADGTPDSTFSADGKLLTNFGGVDEARDVVVQSSGKIVVAGRKCSSAGVCDLAVARYNSYGNLDTTFSGDGKQVVAFGSGDNGTWGGLAIQPDGKIVIGGYMVNASGNYDFAVYRLNPSGSLDATFSGDGRVNFGFGAGPQEEAEDLVLQGGKILVVGETCDASWYHCNFAVARLTSTGSMDTTFSGDGKQTTDFGADDYPAAVAVQPNGKIVVAGEKYTTSAEYFALARYSANGALDTTFSGDGRQTISFGTYAWANGVLVQSDGKIVVAGVGQSGSNNNFALARLNANGALDATFSGDGKVLIDFAGHSDMALALVRQGDGKYVLGGSSCVAQCDFALARVLP
jgi:uncharacterized delta-60 repeat protein